MTRVLRDPRFGNDLTTALPHTASSRLSDRLTPRAPSLLFTDPPLHTALRTAFAAGLSPRARAARAEPIAERVSGVLASWAEGDRVELGAALVHPLLLAEVRSALGMPNDQGREDDVEALFAINSLFDLRRSEREVRAAESCSEPLRRQIADYVAGSKNAFPEIPVGNLESSIEFMMRAAVVTTGSVLLSALVDSTVPSLADAAALDVLIARLSPTTDTGRVTRHEVELSGRTIPAGSTVIALLASASRAPGPAAVCFGGGVHRCLGVHFVHGVLVEVMSTVRRHGIAFNDLVVTSHLTPSFIGVREIEARVRRSN